MLFSPEGVCKTTNKAAGKSAGKPRINVWRARTPPADVPTTTMSRNVIASQVWVNSRRKARFERILLNSQETAGLYKTPAHHLAILRVLCPEPIRIADTEFC